MKIFLTVLMMAQANPLTAEVSYDDYMAPAIFSWCEENKVVQNDDQTGQKEIADDCSAQNLQCKTHSELNTFMNKYVIFAYCSEK